MVLASSLKPWVNRIVGLPVNSIVIRPTAFLLFPSKTQNYFSSIFNELKANQKPLQELKGRLLIIIMRLKASLTYCYEL